MDKRLNTNIHIRHMDCFRQIAITCMIMAWSVWGCGGETNLADCEDPTSGVPCTEKSDFDKMVAAIKAEEYSEAISLGEDLISDEPEDYEIRTYLAAAYAAKAGFDILNALNQDDSDSGSESVLDQLGAFVPSKQKLGDAKYAVALSDMDKAVSTIEAIPATVLADETENPYAPTAKVQLQLYSSGYSVMLINQFVVPTSADEIDLEALQDMTAEDAALIFDSLLAAATADDSSPAAEGINEFLDELDAAEGDSDRDKLVSYLEAANTSE